MSLPHRYNCQINLAEIGPRGQARLRAGVCVVEVGAALRAANWSLAYLAAAGVGTLLLCGDVDGEIGPTEAAGDPLLHVADAGRARIDALRERIRAQNPDVVVNAATSENHTRVTMAVADDNIAGNALQIGAAAASASLLKLVAVEASV